MLNTSFLAFVVKQIYLKSVFVWKWTQVNGRIVEENRIEILNTNTDDL